MDKADEARPLAGGKGNAVKFKVRRGARKKPPRPPLPPPPESEPEEWVERDPEIAALLEFDPAPRQNKRKNGWHPPLQRQFIALLARSGSPQAAADKMDKSRFGIEKSIAHRAPRPKVFAGHGTMRWRCSNGARRADCRIRRSSGHRRSTGAGAARRPTRW